MQPWMVNGKPKLPEVSHVFFFILYNTSVIKVRTPNPTKTISLIFFWGVITTKNVSRIENEVLHYRDIQLFSISNHPYRDRVAPSQQCQKLIYITFKTNRVKSRLKKCSRPEQSRRELERFWHPWCELLVCFSVLWGWHCCCTGSRIIIMRELRRGRKIYSSNLSVSLEQCRL